MPRGWAEVGPSPALDRRGCLSWEVAPGPPMGAEGLGDEAEGRRGCSAGQARELPPFPTRSGQHVEEERVNAEQTPQQPPPNYL